MVALGRREPGAAKKYTVGMIFIGSAPGSAAPAWACRLVALLAYACGGCGRPKASCGIAGGLVLLALAW